MTVPANRKKKKKKKEARKNVARPGGRVREVGISPDRKARKDDKTTQVGIEPTGSDVTEGEGRKGTVSRSLLQIQSEKKASRRELEKVSRCRLQFDLISPGTILGFGARLARERSRFTVPSAGTIRLPRFAAV